MGPTQAIVEMARQMPGGVIRWHEANDIYIRRSISAASQSRRGCNVYQNSLGRLLLRRFVRVEGTRGYYVLKEFLE